MEICKLSLLVAGRQVVLRRTSCRGVGEHAGPVGRTWRWAHPDSGRDRRPPEYPGGMAGGGRRRLQSQMRCGTSAVPDVYRLTFFAATAGLPRRARLWLVRGLPVVAFYLEQTTRTSPSTWSQVETMHWQSSSRCGRFVVSTAFYVAVLSVAIRMVLARYKGAPGSRNRRLLMLAVGARFWSSSVLRCFHGNPAWPSKGIIKLGWRGRDSQNLQCPTALYQLATRIGLIHYLAADPDRGALRHGGQHRFATDPGGGARSRRTAGRLFRRVCCPMSRTGRWGEARDSPKSLSFGDRLWARSGRRCQAARCWARCRCLET